MLTAAWFSISPIASWLIVNNYNSTHDLVLKLKGFNLQSGKLKEFRIIDKTGSPVIEGRNIKFDMKWSSLFSDPVLKNISGDIDINAEFSRITGRPENLLKVFIRKDKKPSKVFIDKFRFTGLFKARKLRVAPTFDLNWIFQGSVTGEQINSNLSINPIKIKLNPTVTGGPETLDLQSFSLGINRKQEETVLNFNSDINNCNIKGSINLDSNLVIKDSNVIVTGIKNLFKDLIPDKLITGSPVLRIKGPLPAHFSFDDFRSSAIPGIFSLKGKAHKNIEVNFGYRHNSDVINITGLVFPFLNAKGNFRLSDRGMITEPMGTFTIKGFPRKFVIIDSSGSILLKTPAGPEKVSVQLTAKKNMVGNKSLELNGQTTSSFFNSKFKAVSTDSNLSGKISILVLKNVFTQDLSFKSLKLEGSLSGTLKAPEFTGDITAQQLSWKGTSGIFKGRAEYKNGNFNITGILLTKGITVNLKFSGNINTKKYTLSAVSPRIPVRTKFLKADGDMIFTLKNGTWAASIKSNKAQGRGLDYGNVKINASGDLTGPYDIKLISQSKSHFLEGKWSTTDKEFKISLILKNYVYKHPSKAFPFTAQASGTLHGTLSTLNLKNPTEILNNLKSISGSLELKSLKLPFYGDTGKIKIDFSTTGSQISFTGKAGNRISISGALNSGKIEGAMRLYGMGLEQHLGTKISKYLTISTNAVFNFSFYRKKLNINTTINNLLVRVFQPENQQKFLTLRNYKPVHLKFDRNNISLKNEVFIIGNSRFSASGNISRDNFSLTLEGNIDPAIFNSWVVSPFKGLSGSAGITAFLKGPWKTPDIKVSLSSDDLRFLLNQTNKFISVKGLRVGISEKNLTFKFKIIENTSLLNAEGEASLRNFRIKDYALNLNGKASGDLSSLFFKDIIRKSSGFLKLNLIVKGSGKKPSISGTVFPDNLELLIRNLPHAITLKKGYLEVNEQFVAFRDLGGDYGDGTFAINGNVNVFPELNFDLNVTAAGVSVNSPTVYSVELNAALRLAGKPDNSTITGRLDVVNGRYIQNYDIVKHVLTFKRFSEKSTHIWDTIPWIGNARLAINLHSSGDLSVENNIANIQLDGALAVDGILKKPELKGKISVLSGTFKIPFLRGQYETDTGSIDFDRTKKPFLTLEGNTSIEDNYGDEVLIKLKLSGPIDKVTIQLSSLPEMEQGQILMLLASGKTTQELRRQWHGDPKSLSGTGSTSYNPVEVYDQPIKQITGDFLSSLVENPIKMVTKLDTIRFELGSDSFQIKLTKKFLKRIALKSEVEVGFMGKNRQEGSVEIKLHDRVSIDSNVRRYVPGINEYEYEQPLKGRIQLKYKIKLKGGIRTILGI